VFVSSLSIFKQNPRVLFFIEYINS